MGTVLLRTTAVRVINQNNGRSTLAYAQLETASQATLISDALREELGLEAVSDPSLKIRTLADQTATCLGRIDFRVESLDNGNRYGIEGALVVPYFSDEESTLPRAADTSRLKQFNGITIRIISNRKRVDILIGLSDKALLTGLTNPT